MDTHNIDELKPCPFCGGAPHLMHCGVATYMIQCLQCKATTDDGCLDRISANWNRRALTAALSDEHTQAGVRALECDHKGKGLAVMSWGACCKACGEPWPFDPALLDVPAVEPEPVAWLDDGTCRAGSDRTSHRVVTTDQKRDMPTAVASSFLIPLYAAPVRSAVVPAQDEAEKLERLTRPIIGIENRTALEAFDIMADRVRSALSPRTVSTSEEQNAPLYRLRENGIADDSATITSGKDQP